MRPQAYHYRKIWEDANGKKIPVGYHIHHIDGNPNNNHPNNLQCVSPIEHYKIHKKQGDNRAASLLLSQMGEYGEYPYFSDTTLWRITNRGLIYKPKHVDVSEIPDVELKNNMDYFESSSPYIEKDYSLLMREIFKYTSRIDTIIIKYYFGIGVDKKSYVEISNELNMKEDAVRQRCNRAIKRLKNNLNITNLYKNTRP